VPAQEACAVQSSSVTNLPLQLYVKMVVLQVLLVCSLLVVLLRLPRAAHFLLRCLKARQNFIRSSVPGPPAGHPILGEPASTATVA
jgi:hypothetical protein